MHENFELSNSGRKTTVTPCFSQLHDLPAIQTGIEQKQDPKLL